MNILYITHRVPYPLNRGDRIRTYHTLQYLSGRANVYLACFDHEGITEQTKNALTSHCRELQFIRLRSPLQLLRAGLALAQGRSATSGYFYSQQLNKLITSWTHHVDFDVVVLSSSGLAQYLALPGLRGLRRIVDMMDVDSQKWADYADSSFFIAHWVYKWESRRLAADEQCLAHEVDGVIVVSRTEADLLRRIAPNAPVHVATNGVDLDHFDCRGCSRRKMGCVFVGALDYKPNVQGIRWFCHNVWPEIYRQHPDCRLRLVGRNPVKAIYALAEQPGVEVVGEVGDVRPYLWNAAVAVVPLHIARGIQNKVLEAMAAGTAVVSSPLPLQGLAARPGVELYQAETISEWIETILYLQHHPEYRNRCEKQGLRYVQTYHRWDDSLKCLDQLLNLSESTPNTEQHTKNADICGEPS